MRIPNHLNRSLLGMSQTNEPAAHFAFEDVARVSSAARAGLLLKRLDQLVALCPSSMSSGGRVASRPNTVKLRV